MPRSQGVVKRISSTNCLRACLEEGVERADHVARACGEARARAGKLDEALEGVAEVADAFEMMAEGVGLRPGSDDQNVAGSIPRSKLR